jgi:hypothetical protein
MALSPERVAELARELGGWFGTPLLCRVGPKEPGFSGQILDGARRWAVLGGRCYALGGRCYALGGRCDAPVVVFPASYRDGIWSLDGKLLPRMLLLFGHPERSWACVPECWRDSPRALEGFLGVSRCLALELWATGEALRRAGRWKHRPKGRRDHSHRDRMQAIRGLVLAWSSGEPVGMPEVAEIAGIRL